MRTDTEILVRTIVRVARKWEDEQYPARREAIALSLECENRFTEPAVRFAVNQQMSLIHTGALFRWIGGRKPRSTVRVGMVGAGNVPFADLQDFLAILLAGHDFLGKVSSRSPHLLPAFARDLCPDAGIAPPRFVDSDTLFREADALIASGSESTIREIEQLADHAGIPPARRLLRGTGFGMAVLDGKETDTERSGLAEDVLLHEGVGCRNVALIWAPAGLSPDSYLDIMAQFRTVFPASERTRGALKIPEALLRAIRFPHAAGDGFLVSKGSPEVQAPGHVRWSEYADFAEVNEFVAANRDSVRIVIGPSRLQAACTCALQPFGTAQRPQLDWEAGGTEVLDFLVNLE